MALAAADPQDRADQLLALTERLTDLLSQETAAFERRRPHEAAATLEETGRLANLYRHESARIRRDPGLLAGLSPDMKRKLVSATSRSWNPTDPGGWGRASAVERRAEGDEFPFLRGQDGAAAAARSELVVDRAQVRLEGVD